MLKFLKSDTLKRVIPGGAFCVFVFVAIQRSYEMTQRL